MAELKQVLELLTALEADGKVVSHTLPTLYDANGDIHLTVRADTVATREQFLADVAGAVDEAESEERVHGVIWVPADQPHDVAVRAAKAAAKKAAKLGGKKSK